MNFARSLICFLLFSYFANGQKPADQGEMNQTGHTIKSTSFYEVDGVVSMEAEHASYINGWSKARKFADLNSLAADSAFTWRGGVLRFDIEFSTPGKYAFWVLARKGRAGGKYSSNDFKVWFDRNLSLGQNPHHDDRDKQEILGLMDADGIQTYAKPVGEGERKRESEVGIGQHQYFIWLSNPKEGKGPCYWNVPTKGKHHMEIVMGEEWDYAIDKVVLIKDNKFTPSGRGPVETSSKSSVPVKEGFDESVVLPPAWAFGVIYGGYTNQQETLERIQQIKDHDYPIDAYWIDSWFWDYQNGGKGPNGYMNFKGDTVAYPDVEKMWSTFSKNNIKGGIWIWDGILQKGNETVFEELKNKGCYKSTPMNTATWHNAGGNSIIGNIDFEKPEVVSYIKQKFKPLFDKGLDFYKLDRNPGLPFAKFAFEATQELGKETKGRGFIIQHVGANDNPEYKRYPTKWSGDSEAKWNDPEFPNLEHYTKGGLSENIEMVSNPRRHEYDIAFLTHDGGGFRYIGNESIVGEELFIRWIQFSVFNPVMEMFSSLYNPSSNLGFKISTKSDSCFRAYTHLRMELFPYIYSYAHLTRQTGKKMIQGDGVNKYQYLFGNELLVGPVNEKSATSKEMFFPEGKWIDYWTGEIFEGNQKRTIPVTLAKVPLFARAGAIIPKRQYAHAIEAGNNQTLLLDIFPYLSSSFTLYEDDGTSNDYLKNRFSTTLFSCDEADKTIRVDIEEIKGNFEGMLKERKYLLQIHKEKSPEQVKINAKQIKQMKDKKGLENAESGWFYDKSLKSVLVKLSSKTSVKNSIVLTF